MTHRKGDLRSILCLFLVLCCVCVVAIAVVFEIRSYVAQAGLGFVL